MNTDTSTPRAPWSLDRIAGHDCFAHATHIRRTPWFRVTGPRPADWIGCVEKRRASMRFLCGDCATTWFRRGALASTWYAMDMECGCGARAWSDDTSVEWHSDTECHRCHAERTEGAA